MNHTDAPCTIFFHIPKTGGQTFHNLVSREYRHELILETPGGLLNSLTWQKFIQGLMRAQPLPRYSAVIGHMKFGVHEFLPGPSRYVTFLRDPVKRFASYYYMLRGMGLVRANHRIDLDRPDWNLSGHETLLRDLDNGQTRALANADWDLPFGHCTEEHLKTAMANLDRYFSFVGLTEHFDISLLALKRLYGWRWHFFARKNITPDWKKCFLAPGVLEAIAGINRFDLQLHAYARERLQAMVRNAGASLRLERRVYVTCNAVHQGIHNFCHPLKQKQRRTESPAFPRVKANFTRWPC